jgi:hypothetical protein
VVGDSTVLGSKFVPASYQQHQQQQQQ